MQVSNAFSSNRATLFNIEVHHLNYSLVNLEAYYMAVQLFLFQLFLSYDCPVILFYMAVPLFCVLLILGRYVNCHWQSGFYISKEAIPALQFVLNGLDQFTLRVVLKN